MLGREAGVTDPDIEPVGIDAEHIDQFRSDDAAQTLAHFVTG